MGKRSGKTIAAGCRARAHDRAPREQQDLVGGRRSFAARTRRRRGPSSERPVFARKTSSRLGWCSSRFVDAAAPPRRARARRRPGRPRPRRGARRRRATTARASPKRSSTSANAARPSGPAGVASTVGRPISALSASGVPSATMCPWSMIPTRSARTSASSRYCVVRKTVTPSSRASRPTSSQSARAALDVEAGRRLVEEEDARPVDERHREIEPALHPARVAAHLAVGGLGQADALEQLVRARRRARRAGAPAAPPAGAGARGRSAAGRAPPPAARRRCASAPAGPSRTTS